MKTKTLLIAAVMFLGLTAAAFAQATYQVGSIPVTAVVNTGVVEKSGDITFTQSSGVVQTGTITVSYGVQITNDTTTGITVQPIATTGGACNFTVSPPVCPAPVTSPPTINRVDNASGQVVVNVFQGTTITVFSLTGVRVNVAGTTLSNLTASISSTQNAIVAGQTSVVVISAISPGIASIKTTTTGTINATTGTVTSNSGAPLNSPIVITIKEGFLNAWGQIAAPPQAGTAAGLRITLSGPPPPGVTITFPATATTDGAGTPTFTTIKFDGSADGTAKSFDSTDTSFVVYYKVTSSTDATKQETLTIPVGLTFTKTSSNLPIPVAAITYVVSMAPIGTPFDPDGNVITDLDMIPRYVASDVGPATLLNVTGTTTTLLIPFAETVTAQSYNTGIAIANTTKDPGKTITGFVSPVQQSGAVTFYFFPATNAAGTLPTSFTYTTTAGSPGIGLDANGRIVSGSTYAVLLSDLLSAAGAPADFSGYLIIVTNFTNAHCLYNISNYNGFSQGAHALVLSGNRDGSAFTGTVPENLNN